MHERADSEPHGVTEGELVHQHLLLVTGVGVVPLVGTEPGQYEEKDGDDEVGKHHVDPHFEVQRRHEGEQSWLLLLGLPVENADAQRHEGVGEVHGLLSLEGDGEVGDGKVSFLK